MPQLTQPVQSNLHCLALRTQPAQSNLHCLALRTHKARPTIRLAQNNFHDQVLSINAHGTAATCAPAYSTRWEDIQLQGTNWSFDLFSFRVSIMLPSHTLGFTWRSFFDERLQCWYGQCPIYGNIVFD